MKTRDDFLTRFKTEKDKKKFVDENLGKFVTQTAGRTVAEQTKGKEELINFLLPDFVKAQNAESVRALLMIAPKASLKPWSPHHSIEEALAAEGTPAIFDLVEKRLGGKDEKKEDRTALVKTALKQKNMAMVNHLATPPERHLLGELDESEVIDVFKAAIENKNKTLIKFVTDKYYRPKELKKISEAMDQLANEALPKAVESLDADMVKALLSFKGIDPTQKDKDGKNLLHRLVDVASKNLSSDLEEKLAHNAVPIITALQQAHSRIVNDPNNELQTPLVYAMRQYAHPLVFQALVSVGSSFYPHAIIKKEAAPLKRLTDSAATTASIQATLPKEEKTELESLPARLKAQRSEFMALSDQERYSRFVLNLSALLLLSNRRLDRSKLNQEDFNAIQNYLKHAVTHGKKETLEFKLIPTDISHFITTLWDEKELNSNEKLKLFVSKLKDDDVFRDSLRDFHEKLKSLMNLDTTQFRGELHNLVIENATHKRPFGISILGTLGHFLVLSEKLTLTERERLSELTFLLFTEFNKPIGSDNSPLARNSTEFITPLLENLLITKSEAIVQAVTEFFKNYNEINIYDVLADVIKKSKKSNLFSMPFLLDLEAKETDRRKAEIPLADLPTLRIELNEVSSKPKKLDVQIKKIISQMPSRQSETTNNPVIHLLKLCQPHGSTEDNPIRYAETAPAAVTRIMVTLVNLYNNRDNPVEAIRAALAGCASALTAAEDKSLSEGEKSLLQEVLPDFYQLLGISEDLQKEIEEKGSNSLNSLATAFRKVQPQVMRDFPKKIEAFVRYLFLESNQDQGTEFLAIKEAVDKKQPKKTPKPAGRLHAQSTTPSVSPAADRGDTKQVTKRS